MPTANPFTDAEKQRLRELHAQGMSCHRIAKTLGRSSETISRYAKQLGLTFDRSKTEVAVAAKTIDNRARRADLVERMYRRAGVVLERLEADAYRHRVTAGYASYLVEDPVPPAADERHLSGSIANYINTAVKAEQVDADTGDSEAKSMLGELSKALDVAAQRLKEG